LTLNTIQNAFHSLIGDTLSLSFNKHEEYILILFFTLALVAATGAVAEKYYRAAIGNKDAKTRILFSTGINRNTRREINNKNLDLMAPLFQ
jgi:hypothetical protein